MDSTKTEITENDYVELTEQVGKWPAGTRGTAVLDHGPAKMIEVSDDRGQELDMFDVMNEKLKLIKHYPMTMPLDA
jgi:hypothetical protein